MLSRLVISSTRLINYLVITTLNLSSQDIGKMQATHLPQHSASVATASSVLEPHEPGCCWTRLSQQVLFKAFQDSSNLSTRLQTLPTDQLQRPLNHKVRRHCGGNGPIFLVLIFSTSQLSHGKDTISMTHNLKEERFNFPTVWGDLVHGQLDP